MNLLLSPEFLFEGAVCAMEQAGGLLESAKNEFERGSNASTIVLAAFGREEFGRARILLSLGEKAQAGDRVTSEDVEKACGDHVTKQQWSRLSLTFKADKNSERGRLVETMQRYGPGTKEFNDAYAAMEEINKRVLKQLTQRQA